LAKLGYQRMDAILLITWLFFELIFASVGFVIVKTIVFLWRLFRFAVSGRQEAIGPLITAGDRDKLAMQMYFGVGVVFWLVLLAVFVL